MLENLLKEYDLLHSSIINGGKVQFNINYLLDSKVYISLVGLLNGEEKKASYDFQNDEEFKFFVLPKILQRFLSKNLDLKVRKIMGTSSSGTMILESQSSKDKLVIRNCTTDVMDLADKLNQTFKSVSDLETNDNKKIILDEGIDLQLQTYMKYNIIFDYATYKNDFFSSLENDEETNKEQMLILNIARYATTFKHETPVWQEIIESYKDNEKVSEICNQFKSATNDDESMYTKALILAEYEKDNDLLIHNSNEEVDLALQACELSINLYNDSYPVYWRDKERYYSGAFDTKHQTMCLEFYVSRDLRKKDLKSIEVANRITRNKNIVGKLKKIKKDKASFKEIINNPLDKEEIKDYQIILDIDKDKLLRDAEEQAKELLEVEKERNQLKKDAEDFARIILEKEQEQKEISKAAEEQAKELFEALQERNKLKKDAEDFAKIIMEREQEQENLIKAAEEQALKIFKLEQENKELKKLAELNAQFIFDRDQKLLEEESLRDYMETIPVKAQDIDKLNSLLSLLTEIKELDFAINHPTTMQDIMFLEERILTYLSTHKNIVTEEDKIVPIEKEEMLETKPVVELLAMIRNAYLSSHVFEKDGRHTLINFNPVDEDTFRVSLYSIKDDSEDVLMDAFFEEYQLTDEVLEEICNIFKTDTAIVASKTDNIPPDKADYLVIDNMDNALRFCECSKDLIERVKKYL